jgi:hypothetical protein
VALVSAVVASLAFAGRAAAGVGIGKPIGLNTQSWSGNAGYGTIPPTVYFDTP